MFKKLLILPLVIALTTSCSTMQKHTAELGQAADSISTVTFLNMGIEEANPIIASNLWILIVKPFIPPAIRYLTKGNPEVCRSIDFALSSVGFGAAGWNIGVMAGGGPIAVFLGLASLGIPYIIGHNPECGDNDLE